MFDLNLFYAFGINALLGEVDDPQLWEAALRQHWVPPDDPGCMVEALRFGIGRRLGDGEAPRGEANEGTASRSGMVDVDEWGFERMDAANLHPRMLAPADSPPAVKLPGGPEIFMPPGGVMTADTKMPAPVPPVQNVFISLTISRPSLNETQAVVYSATSAPGAGNGSAYLWQRLDDGSWEQTGERLAWWIT